MGGPLADSGVLSPRNPSTSTRSATPSRLASWSATRVALVSALLGTSAIAPARADTPTERLSPTTQNAFDTLPSEKPYAVRLHFLRSNERRHDLFFPSLYGLGAGYLGVGADQNYTLAAIAKADIVWLVDIDGDVIDWHQIYAALIPIAETPISLCALLAGNRDLEVQAALKARWGSAAPQLFTQFLRYRGYILQHLTVERTYRRHGVPVTWLSDPTLYAHIRKLMREHRVFARVGDLHGETTLQAIAAAATKARIPVRTFYLSNVEQWFRYSPQFIANVQAMPRDRSTVLLRTLARGDLPTPELDRWHFSVETLDDFLAKVTAQNLPLRTVQGLAPLMVAGSTQTKNGLSLLGNVAQHKPPPPALLWLPPLRLAE